jgi:predicted membrane-bound mannosyltransferase
MSLWQNIIRLGAPRRAMMLGPLLIGVNALLIWTLEHTDIVAFAVVLVFGSLIVLAFSRLL